MAINKVSHDALHEAYEDAVFALDFDELMEKEGQALLLENERLKESTDLDYPKDLDARCLRIIDRYFRKKNARQRLKALKKPLMAASAVFFCLFIAFIVPFCTVSAFRAASINLVFDMFDIGTTIRVDETATSSDFISAEIAPSWLPSGTWKTVFLSEDGLMYILKLEDENQNSVFYSEISADSSTLTIDTENAVVSTDITVNGYKGMSSIKDNSVIITWIDDQKSLIKTIEVRGSSDIATLEIALRIAESIQ